MDAFYMARVMALEQENAALKHSNAALTKEKTALGLENAALKHSNAVLVQENADLRHECKAIKLARDGLMDERDENQKILAIKRSEQRTQRSLSPQSSPTPRYPVPNWNDDPSKKSSITSFGPNNHGPNNMERVHDVSNMGFQTPLKLRLHQSNSSSSLVNQQRSLVCCRHY